MQTVTLMRHAKSSWADANQSDHDRPLNKRGNRDAPEMAQRLVERNTIPTLILCSSAQRTRETASHLLNIFGAAAPRVQYLETLYLASPSTMLAALAPVADNEHVMLLAHNPGMEELSAHLQGVSDDIMPTAAVRQFSCTSISALHNALSADNRQNVELIYSDFPKSQVV